jgi:hypothetical protein
MFKDQINPSGRVTYVGADVGPHSQRQQQQPTWNLSYSALWSRIYNVNSVSKSDTGVRVNHGQHIAANSWLLNDHSSIRSSVRQGHKLRRT